LFVNARGLHMVQGFTSDHTLLRAAILSKGPGPHLPDVFTDGHTYGWEDPGAALSNLKFIAEYMSGIQGKKNLLWLSAIFPSGWPHGDRQERRGCHWRGFSNSTRKSTI